MRLAWPALLLAATVSSPATADGRVLTARPTSIRGSVERVVDRIVLSHLGPCQLAGREGVPCFPVSIEAEGPRLSVKDALQHLGGTPSPAPGAPTVAEIQGQMAAAPTGPPPSASGGVGFDPVCTVKNLWRRVSGKATTYYLYRTWDAHGERPMLTDRPLDPRDYRANLDFHFEPLGQFDSECAAVSAWNRALRDAAAHKPDHETQPPPEQPS